MPVMPRDGGRISYINCRVINILGSHPLRSDLIRSNRNLIAMTLPQQNYQVLRMKDLPTKVGLKPSTIYALIAKGDFPPPFKFIPGGRAAGWLEQTIDEWLEAR